MQVQAGQLIAERFAAAGRHDGDRVAAAQHRSDDVFLAGTEAADAEDAAQRLLEVARRDRHVKRVATVVPIDLSAG